MDPERVPRRATRGGLEHLALSLTHTHSLSLSHSLTLPHSLILSHSLSLSHFLYHSLTPSHSLSLSLNARQVARSWIEKEYQDALREAALKQAALLITLLLDRTVRQVNIHFHIFKCDFHISKCHFHILKRDMLGLSRVRRP